ncbi:Erythronate-4-phosphate dehydrogenase [Halioglobus japonicus]|nr:Erythronate-4-phosphate dehydrogenase [Halioglobus japonicus]
MCPPGNCTLIWQRCDARRRLDVLSPMNLTVLADENIPAVEEYFGPLAGVRRISGRSLERTHLDGVDILLVRSVSRVNEALLRETAVKFVGTATSGFDHIDRDYLARQGIGFAHAPGSNANSVVEYVLAAIAATEEKLEQLLAGGSVGIVGYGVIGKAVAARFAALGVQCRIYDPWLEQSTIPNASALDEVLDCDVVTLHAQLTSDAPWPSYHLLGSRELQQLRAGTLLINASRGSVLDNAALAEYLQARPDAFIVMDVWEGEPEPNPDLLAQVTLGSAHIAGYSWDGKLQATRMLRDAASRYLQLPAPAEVTQPEGAAPIQVSDDFTQAGLLRFLVQARYDIYLDDSMLRQTVAQIKLQADGGAGFDLLRKSYRKRRELAGSLVRGLRLPEHRAMAHALGCIAE